MLYRVLLSALFLSASSIAPVQASEALPGVDTAPLKNLPYENRVDNGLQAQDRGSDNGELRTRDTNDTSTDALKDKARRAIEEALRGASPDLDIEIIPVPSPQPTQLPPAKPVFELADDLDGLFDQLKRTGDKRRAERISAQIWQKWQASDSRSVDLLTHWARGASSKKDYAVALDLLDQVVTLRPDYAEGWNQRATLHYAMRNFDKSIADIERTLALEPRHYGALAGLGAILQQLGRKEAALEAWYRALNVYPAMEGAQKAVLDLEEDLAGRGI